MTIYPFRLYIREKTIRTLCWAGILANGAIWIWLWWQIQPQEEFVFLHYNVLFGVDRVGPWWFVFLYPAIGTLIQCVHIVVGWIFFDTERLVAYLLLAIALLAHLWIGIGSYLLVFLNV